MNAGNGTSNEQNRTKMFPYKEKKIYRKLVWNDRKMKSLKEMDRTKNIIQVEIK